MPSYSPGLHSRRELEDLAGKTATPDGIRDYLASQLGEGQLALVTDACRRSPELFPALLQLSADLETPYAVRIGVGAVLEELGPEGLLGHLVEPIAGIIAGSGHPQVRADAAHYLGLTGNPAARVALQALVKDPDAEVREIAAEALEALPPMDMAANVVHPEQEQT